jgi:hypothetical protein
VICGKLRNANNVQIAELSSALVGKWRDRPTDAILQIADDSFKGRRFTMDDFLSSLRVHDVGAVAHLMSQRSYVICSTYNIIPNISYIELRSLLKFNFAQLKP